MKGRLSAVGALRVAPVETWFAVYRLRLVLSASGFAMRGRKERGGVRDASGASQAII